MGEKVKITIGEKVYIISKELLQELIDKKLIIELTEEYAPFWV